MAATAVMIARLRKMVDEPTEATYSDELVAEYIETYPLLDVLGTDPQDVDFSDIMFALRDMAVQEGYAPPHLLGKVEEISTAANKFRRDCINLILDEGDANKEQILEAVEKTLEQIKVEIR